MTTEEKARAYDKAIEKIKYVMEHGVSPTLNKEDLQDIFPELKESEDERIIKAQLDYWRSVGGKEWHGVPVQETIAWLEKQCERKPAWSEEDKHRLEDTIYFLDTAKKHYASTVELDACINWLKSLKLQKQWKPTEEQIHWLKWAINRLPDTEKANEAEAVLEDLLEVLKGREGQQ